MVVRETRERSSPNARPRLAGEGLGDLARAARPQLQGRALLGAEPGADVVAVDHEVLAVLGDAARQDVDVGIAGVPVVDIAIQSSPVSRSTAMSAMSSRVKARRSASSAASPGRDDEAETMPVAVAARGEDRAVGCIAACVERRWRAGTPSRSRWPMWLASGAARKARPAWRSTRTLITTRRWRGWRRAANAARRSRARGSGPPRFGPRRRRSALHRCASRRRRRWPRGVTAGRNRRSDLGGRACCRRARS